MISLADVIKQRSQSSADAIINALSGMAIEDLVTELFVTSHDQFAMNMIKQYEKQLVLCLVDPVKFKNQLPSFFESMAVYIKANKLYKQFYDYSYFIYRILVSKEVTNSVIVAYHDLLVQQVVYFQYGKTCYGITTTGEPMFMDELEPYLDFPLYELRAKYKREVDFGNPMDRKFLVERYFHYGYNIANPLDLDERVRNEQMQTNAIYQMAHFIDEHTEEFLPKPFCLPASGGYRMPTEWKKPEWYKEQLLERLYFLPPKGVMILCRNCKDITSIFMKEKFMEDNIFLLYKVQFEDDTYASGYYDTKRQIFYSPWAFSSGEVQMHDTLMGFVLQNYCHLTTHIDIDVKRIYAVKIVQDIMDRSIQFHDQQPVVQYVSLNPKYTHEGGKERQYENFDKTKYKATPIDMNPQIRKLPKGYKASEEALKLARELGYVIQEGQTFVRPFKKIVHKLDNCVENDIDLKM